MRHWAGMDRMRSMRPKYSIRPGRLLPLGSFNSQSMVEQSTVGLGLGFRRVGLVMVLSRSAGKRVLGLRLSGYGSRATASRATGLMG